MGETDIRDRLERILDEWVLAKPDERANLVLEKLRLEALLHQLHLRPAF